MNFFADDKDYDFRVLSCNVRIFNVYEHLRDVDYRSSVEMMHWLRDNDADVICLQEYYSNNSKLFRSKEVISASYPYSYIEPFLVYENQIFGMAIFSKHPIVRVGSVRFKEKSNNQIIYSDIVVKKDTIRCYNIHLQSMSIDEKDILEGTISKETGTKWLNVLIRYKRGSVMRSTQVEALIRHLQTCTYPSIVCGDLNEPPVGYAYEQISELLPNCYEQTATGFGTTYRGKLPFLRIDNIFAADELTPVDFKIHKEITYSDHYPISCGFKIK
ncbi:MAG: endonuclease/exonuclease/phosphatase family protein [Cytophagaceae bacterium]|nr:endonuclease/exonuclease/phosphatase family protein [Cytophagaceae bacterium]MDW8456330.1 endonuclease/exonuclease/phosphatase family protein [Cytophagaceae bacterium]